MTYMSFYGWLMDFHPETRPLIHKAVFKHAEKWPHKNLTDILRAELGEELFNAYRAYKRITTGEK